MTLDATDGESWRIYALSDAHIGSATCDEALLKQWIQHIADDPRGRCIITGDLISAIGKTDKRFSLSALADWVLLKKARSPEDILGIQASAAVEWLRPIADRIDGYVSGNHEDKPLMWNGTDTQWYICEQLGRREAYLGSQALLTYKFRLTKTRTRTLDIYLHHGTSGSTTEAALRSLKETAGLWEADVFLAGHCHATAGEAIAVGYKDRKSGELRQRLKHVGLCGTFDRSFTTGSNVFSDRKKHRPHPVGSLLIEHNPARFETEITAKVAA